MKLSTRCALTRRIAVTLAVVAVLCGDFSCAWLKTAIREVRDHAVEGGVPTGIAILTFPVLGPLGAGAVTFLTFVATKGMVDTIALKNGEIVGEEALRKEIERWKAAAGEAEEHGLQMESFAKTAYSQKGAIQRTANTLRNILAAIGLWGIVKYLWPWARSARNFWGGLIGMIRREPGALRLLISANGIAHTEKPPALQVAGFAQPGALP